MSTLTLAIRHTTHYAFSEPVMHALQRLRLTPKETQGQRIIEWKMHFEHAQAELVYDDQHFNHVTHFASRTSFQSLFIQWPVKASMDLVLGDVQRSHVRQMNSIELNKSLI